MAEEIIVNKVAQSGLITLQLEDFIPNVDIAILDLKDFLFRELMLKEKEFRTSLKEHNWSTYEGKSVGIMCSTEALMPQWAWMLAASYLQPVAKLVVFGDTGEVLRTVVREAISKLRTEDYRDERVVVKGCGDEPVHASAYLEIVLKLQPVVKSIMYGEPCSTVPIWKNTVK